MFPVDEPMNTFTPGMSSALIPFVGSPSRTNEQIMSVLSLVAPIWKAVFVKARPSASSIFSFRASGVMVAGLVFGMSNTVVTPPATAAFDSVTMSALCVSPGSRKCTCASIPPAMRCFPSRFHTSASGFFCVSMCLLKS